MIHFNQVSKRYATGQQALQQVSFQLQQGEMMFLTGHSGAGKSTLLKLIMRIERCTQGQLIVNGQNLHRLSKQQIPFLRRHIGIIFQDTQLLPQQSLFDNVALPLRIAGNHRRQDIGRRVRAALDKVGLLHKEKLYPEELSGGEQQRVGIARAIVNKPPILLADEPTGNLDPELSAEIMTLFSQLNQLGVSVLVATHDIALIQQLSHRILHLQQGHLVEHHE